MSLLKVRLTLQEKLRDLHDGKKLTLTALSETTGISIATLQRPEANDDHHASYTDVATLATFYDVSADYLFGQTDNRHLLSELISREDFIALLNAIEIYIDRKVVPQMKTLNQMYQFAEEKIKEQGIAKDGDEILSFLQQAVVNEDEYLRF